MKKEQETIKKLYDFICKSEKLNKVALRFMSVGKGGAKCTYIGSKPVSIDIDLNRTSFGSAYVLCHEVAHQIEIVNSGNTTHNASYKRTFARLLNKYENCEIARQLIF